MFVRGGLVSNALFCRQNVDNDLHMELLRVLLRVMCERRQAKWNIELCRYFSYFVGNKYCKHAAFSSPHRINLFYNRLEPCFSPCESAPAMQLAWEVALFGAQKPYRCFQSPSGGRCGCFLTIWSSTFNEGNFTFRCLLLSLDIWSTFTGNRV